MFFFHYLADENTKECTDACDILNSRQQIDESRNFALISMANELIDEFRSITTFDELFLLLNENDDDINKSFQYIKQLMEVGAFF